MQPQQRLGLIGSIILFIGVFCPTYSGGTFTDIFFSNGNMVSDLVLPLAIASFVLILTRRYKWLLHIGWTCLALILYHFYFDLRTIRVLTDSAKLLHSLGDASASNYIHKLQFGWGLLFVGAGLIIGSALIKNKTENPNKVSIQPMKPDLSVLDEDTKSKSKFQTDQGLVSDDKFDCDTMECPMCAEVIKSKAAICRFCGHLLTVKDSNDIYNIAKDDDNNIVQITVIKFKNLISQKNKAELIIISSILSVIISFVTPWGHYELGSVKDVSMIHSQHLLLLILLYSYPLVMLLLKKQIFFAFTLICSALSTLLMIRYLYINYLGRYGQDFMYTVGVGPWLALIASVLYVIGTLYIIQQNNQKQI